MVLGSGVFGRSLGHEDRALRNGIGALTKGTSESSLAPSPCEDTVYEPGAGSHQTPNPPAP